MHNFNRSLPVGYTNYSVFGVVVSVFVVMVVIAAAALIELSA